MDFYNEAKRRILNYYKNICTEEEIEYIKSIFNDIEFKEEPVDLKDNSLAFFEHNDKSINCCPRFFSLSDEEKIGVLIHELHHAISNEKNKFDFSSKNFFRYMFRHGATYETKTMFPIIIEEGLVEAMAILIQEHYYKENNLESLYGFKSGYGTAVDLAFLYLEEIDDLIKKYFVDKSIKIEDIKKMFLETYGDIIYNYLNDISSEYGEYTLCSKILREYYNILLEMVKKGNIKTSGKYVEKSKIIYDIKIINDIEKNIDITSTLNDSYFDKFCYINEKTNGKFVEFIDKNCLTDKMKKFIEMAMEKDSDIFYVSLIKYDKETFKYAKYFYMYIKYKLHIPSDIYEIENSDILKNYGPFSVNYALVPLINNGFLDFYLDNLYIKCFLDKAISDNPLVLCKYEYYNKLLSAIKYLPFYYFEIFDNDNFISEVAKNNDVDQICALKIIVEKGIINRVKDNRVPKRYENAIGKMIELFDIDTLKYIIPDVFEYNNGAFREYACSIEKINKVENFAQKLVTRIKSTLNRK